MYLAKIALAIAGVIALVYLAMLFKSVIDTMSALQKTLDAVNRDLVKLESPLNTVGQVSNTIDEVQASAKRAAMGAIKVFSQGTTKLGDKFNTADKKNGRSPKTAEITPDAPAANFQPVTEDEGSSLKAASSQTTAES